MLIFSTLKIIAILAFLVFALLGYLFYLAARHGWMRNGYFRIPSVILIVLGLFVAFQAIGNGITFAVIGLHIEAHPVAALSINGLSEIVVMLLGAGVIAYGSGQDLRAVFRLEGIRETKVFAYVLAIPIILAAQFAGGALSAIWERLLKFFPDLYQLLNQYETASDKTMQGLVTATGPIDLALILLFVAIVPALAEETLFRGFAQTNIERSGKWHARPITALLVASFLFALVHASVFKLPGLFLLGLTIGWMTYRTNNLFVGGIGHAINNGFIVAALYLSPSISSNANSGIIGTEDLSATQALAMLVIILPIFAVLLFLFMRASASVTARGNAEREVHAMIWKTVQPEGFAPHHFDDTDIL